MAWPSPAIKHHHPPRAGEEALGVAARGWRWILIPLTLPFPGMLGTHWNPREIKAFSDLQVREEILSHKASKLSRAEDLHMLVSGCVQPRAAGMGPSGNKEWAGTVSINHGAQRVFFLSWDSPHLNFSTLC